MKLKSLAAVAIIAVAGISNSFATNISLGPISSNASFSSTVTGSFLDTFTFTLAKPSNVAASLTNVALTFGSWTYNGITGLSASLNGSPLFSSTSTSGPATVTVFAGVASLPAGGFSLTVQGNAGTGGGSYGGNIVAAPVPEPETFAMLLAGLGLMGVIGRRRSNSNAA